MHRFEPVGVGQRQVQEDRIERRTTELEQPLGEGRDVDDPKLPGDDVFETFGDQFGVAEVVLDEQEQERSDVHGLSERGRATMVNQKFSMFRTTLINSPNETGLVT